MKETIRDLLLYLLVFYLVVSIFSGITLPVNLAYVLASLFVLSLAMMMAKPLLSFLTVKVNFLTLFLVGGILIFGATFLLESLMPGFVIEAATFEGFTLGSIVVNGFDMIPLVTMACVAVSGSLICSIFNELD